MQLEHILRQIESDRDNLRHDRSLPWIVAHPPWHIGCRRASVTPSRPVAWPNHRSSQRQPLRGHGRPSCLDPWNEIDQPHGEFARLVYQLLRAPDPCPDHDNQGGPQQKRHLTAIRYFHEIGGQEGKLDQKNAKKGRLGHDPGQAPNPVQHEMGQRCGDDHRTADCESIGGGQRRRGLKGSHQNHPPQQAGAR